MRKKLFTFLLALATSVGLSWATDPIVIVTNTSQSSYTQGDITITCSKPGTDSDGFYLQESGNETATITNSGSSTISQIELEIGWFPQNRSYVRANGAEPTSSDQYSITFSNVNSNNVTLTITNEKIQIRNVTITFADEGGSAQTGLQVTEFTVPASWQNDQTPVTASDLPGFVAYSFEEAGAWTAPTEGTVKLLYTFDEGVKATYFINGVWGEEYVAGFGRSLLYSWASYGERIFYTSDGSTPAVDPEPTPAEPTTVITTNKSQSSYTQGNITITCSKPGDSDGFYLQESDNGTATITVSGSSTISQIELEIGWFPQNRSYVRANSAEPTSSDQYSITFSNVNSNNVTLTITDEKIQIRNVTITLADEGGSTPAVDPTPTPSATGVIFANCYDCWRTPEYPTISGQCYLHYFDDPRVGNGNPSGPWKLEFVENYNSSSTEYDSDIVKSDVAGEYGKNPAEMEVYRLYQWQNGAYQPVAYGVLYAYANENNQVEHAAFFEASGFWGCYLTDNTHSYGDNINITFNEDASTGFADLHGEPAPAVDPTPTPSGDGDKLAGAFSVGGNKVVYFSKANLQATTADNGATWTWGFAENQWDYVGNNAANNAINGGGSVSTNGPVDLFAWSSTDNNYFGINNSINEVDYSGDFKDWGAKKGSDWRTLTINEWQYLLEERNPGSSSANYTSYPRYTNAQILTDGTAPQKDIKGIILFPDDFNDGGESIDGVTWGSINPSFFSSYPTTCTTAGWATLESMGCVFLPSAGSRQNFGDEFAILDANLMGNYWSSTLYSGEPEDPQSIAVGGGTLGIGTSPRYWGMSVRLVSETAPSGGSSTPANVCGDGLTWELSEGVLTISYDGVGTGEMTDFDYEYESPVNVAPWKEYKSEITTVIVGDGVKSIGNHAFNDLSENFTAVTIANSVERIGLDAFMNAQWVTEITLPSALQTIDKEGLANCGFTSITIPSGVTSIGNKAFCYCNGLTSLTCEATTPPTLGSSVFSGISGKSNIPLYVPSGSVAAYEAASQWNAFNVKAIPGSGSTSANGSCGDGLTWELSEGVLTISYDGVGTGEMTDFGYEYDQNPVNVAPWKEYKSAITTVVIGDGVKSIGNNAFNDLSENFTAVTIANSVERIGVNAFLNAEEITEITLPSSLKTIDEQGFANCGFTSITIPSGVTSIGYKAFCYCRDLTSLTCEATTPPALASSVFYKVRSSTSSLSSIPLYVPSESVAAYEAAAQWNDFDIRGYDPAPEPSGTTVTWDLSDMASMGTQGGYFKAKGITLMAYGVDNGMTGDGIYGGAYFGGPFVFTTSLGKFTKIEVTNSYLYDQPAFSGDGWTLDGTNAVWEGTPAALVSLVSNFGGITQIKFTIDPNTSTPANSCGDGLTWAVNDGVLTISYDGVGTGSMDNYDDPLSMPWYGQNITSVVLPEGLISIGQNAFAFINTFSQITLPSTLQYILMNAFSGCGLTSVTIPENVKGISASAFISSQSLATVTFEPTTPPRVGGNAFEYCHNDLIIYYPCESRAQYYKDMQADIAYYHDKMNNCPAPPSNLHVTELEPPASWSGKSTYLAVADMPGFEETDAELAKTWEAPTNCNSILIYHVAEQYGDDKMYYHYFNAGTFVASEEGWYDLGTVYSNYNSGIKTFYTSSGGGSTPVGPTYLDANFAIDFMSDPYTVVGGGALPTGVEVAGDFHDGQHGYSSPVITIPVTAGNYLVKMGACQYSNQDGSVKNEDGSVTYTTLATNLGDGKCYDQNPSKNYVADIITIPSDQIIKVHGAQYTPFFSIEKMPEIPAFTDFELNFQTNPYNEISGAKPEGTVIAGSFHDNLHGYQNVEATVPVKAGKYRLTLGACEFDSNAGTVMSETNEELASFNQNLGAGKCYHNNTTKNIVSVIFDVDKDQTITIDCGQYTPYMKLEAVTSYAVEFALGDAEGVAPATLDVTVGNELTMPVNKTLYKAGYTLTGWSDGVNTYPIGESFTPANDVVLTPVFTANEADLLNASSDVTVKWYFGGDNGAPTMSYEGTSGLLVAQATIGNKTVDVKLAIDATSGKFAPQPTTEWANVKVGTIFTYPYKEGMTVDVHTYSGNVTYYVADAEGKVTCGVNDYYSFIEVTYPASAPTTAVVIGDPNDAEQVSAFLSTYDGQTIDELIIDRPVLNNMYNTLCLPFDMNAAQIAASSLNGVEIREFTGASVEGTTLNLSVGDPVNAVVAGRPYFVKYSAASQLDDLHFEDVTINNALLDNMAVTFDGVTFKGTFTPFVMPNGLNFQGGYLFLGQNNQLFWPNTSNPLKPFRAYFYVNVESSTPGNAPKYRGMPARIVEGKNVATGVENAQSANQSTKVIVNGQLIIIKNDVRYNAQGQKVK